MDRQKDGQTGRYADRRACLRRTERHEDRNTLRQAIRHTYVWRDGQTEIKTDGVEEIQTDIHTVTWKYRQRHRQGYIQISMPADRQTSRLTDRQANDKANRYTGKF